MSVSRHTTSRPACLPSSSIVSASSRASSSVFMNAPSPTFTSRTIASAPRGDLLRHDAGGDQRDVVDGRGHVAQRVEQLVGRNEIGGLPDDREPDLAHLRDELVDGELDAEAGDRLELVERAAGVTEAAAAHLPERHAARGDDRADGERRLVAHAAGRVLVDHLAAERGAQVDRLAAADHRVGERERLGGRSARGSTPPCRTRPSGSRAPRRARSRARARRARPSRAPRRRACAGSAPRRESQAGGQRSTIGWPGMPRDGALPPSHAFTVAPTSANSPSWMRPAAFRPST